MTDTETETAAIIGTDTVTGIGTLLATETTTNISCNLHDVLRSKTLSAEHSKEDLHEVNHIAQYQRLQTMPPEIDLTIVNLWRP